MSAAGRVHHGRECTSRHVTARSVVVAIEWAIISYLLLSRRTAYTYISPKDGDLSPPFPLVIAWDAYVRLRRCSVLRRRGRLVEFDEYSVLSRMEESRNNKKKKKNARVEEILLIWCPYLAVESYSARASSSASFLRENTRASLVHFFLWRRIGTNLIWSYFLFPSFLKYVWIPPNANALFAWIWKEATQFLRITFACNLARFIGIAYSCKFNLVKWGENKRVRSGCSWSG